MQNESFKSFKSSVSVSISTQIMENIQYQLYYDEKPAKLFLCSIPFIRNRTIRKEDNILNRWVIGFDNKDRDGLFLGRQFEPVNIGNRFELI